MTYILIAGEREVILGNGEGEVLGHPVAIEHGAGGKPDLIGTTQRLALARDSLGDSCQVGLGGGE